MTEADIVASALDRFLEGLTSQEPPLSTFEVTSQLERWERKRFNLSLQFADQLEIAQEELKSAKKNYEKLVKGDEEVDDDEDNNEVSLNDIIKSINQATKTLRNLKSKRKFTHSEMSPLALMGVASSLMPFANMNPAPRGTYAAAQVKQGLGVGIMPYTYPTTGKYLVGPSRPMVETSMYQAAGLSELPGGQMVSIVILTYSGYNQEDAFIFKKEAVDRGLFMTKLVYSFKATFSPGALETGVTEIPGVPTDEVAAKAKRRYGENVFEHLDERGIARLGSHIKPGQCVIGKVKRITITDKRGNQIPRYVDASEYASQDRYGIVEHVDPGKIDGMDTYMVRVYQLKRPSGGDKYSSRHAQKTTEGLEMMSIDMPYAVSPDGKKSFIPDLIMNPHAIPSRMTIGHIIEMIASKVGAIRGERIDGSAFQDFDLDGMRETLRRHGYASHGSQQMYNGQTGELMEGEIFSGFCYYQVLSHMASKKIQARYRGAVMPDTRQPNRGRAKGGGPRIGGMEDSAMLSAGSSNLLYERLMIASDEFNPPVCRKCGEVALFNAQTGTLKCAPCGREISDKSEMAEHFAIARLPYAFMKAKQMMAGMGQRITFGLGDATM